MYHAQRLKCYSYLVEKLNESYYKLDLVLKE